MSEFMTVAKIGEIPDQEGRAFKIIDAMVAVFNDGGVYRAIDDMCPHAGASLASGFYENDVVTCPWHAWQFKVSDGSFCGNPRLKSDVYAVRVVGDEIQVSTKPVNRPDESPRETGLKSRTQPDTEVVTEVDGGPHDGTSHESPSASQPESAETSSEVSEQNHE